MNKLVITILAFLVFTICSSGYADQLDLIKEEISQLKSPIETPEQHAVRFDKLLERERLYNDGKITEGQFRAEELGIYFIFLNKGTVEVRKLLKNTPDTYFPVMRHLRKLTVAEIQKKSEEFKNPTTLKYLASLN